MNRPRTDNGVPARRWWRGCAVAIGGWVLVGWLAGSSLQAQPSPPESLEAVSTDGLDAGITVLGNPNLSFVSAQDYANGVTVDHATLKLTLTLGLRWSLQVRAAGDLQSGMYSIPISTLRVQPVNIGNATTVRLSTVDQVLLTGLLTNVTSLAPTFRYMAAGGNLYYKPGGNYSTVLTFTFTPL